MTNYVNKFSLKDLMFIIVSVIVAVVFSAKVTNTYQYKGYDTYSPVLYSSDCKSMLNTTICKNDVTNNYVLVRNAELIDSHLSIGIFDFDLK